MEILKYTLDQLTQLVKDEYGKGLYHSSALYHQIFKHGNAEFHKAKEFESSPRFTQNLKKDLILSPGQIIESFDEDSLTKFITRLEDGKKIESVIIPMNNRYTLCVSSQVGCKRGCKFCQTAKLGFSRNLTAQEIIGQVYNAKFNLKKNIKNIVFMGMGEPFDNYSHMIQSIKIMNEQKGFNIAPRHITISTCGVLNGIESLGKLNITGIRLAISINASDDEKRAKLMPIARSSSLHQLKTVLQNYPLPKRGCFLFEYILIKGFNDSYNDAINLVEYIKPLPVRLNLIPYNPVSGFNYKTPCDDEMNRFAQVLKDAGIFVIKRWSKGRSVSAGCGQLGQL